MKSANDGGEFVTLSKAKTLTSTEDADNLLHSKREVTDIGSSEVSSYGQAIVHKSLDEQTIKG